MDTTFASVRYIVDDVSAAIDFYTTHLGFTLRTHPAPAFADVTYGPLRVLLSGPQSSGALATPADTSGAGVGGVGDARGLQTRNRAAALHTQTSDPPKPRRDSVGESRSQIRIERVGRPVLEIQHRNARCLVAIRRLSGRRRSVRRCANA